MPKRPTERSEDVSKKRAILLGGTGAIGEYLAPELVRLGFAVDVTSRSASTSGVQDMGIRYIKGDALNVEFLKETLSGKAYDVIIDFMVYATSDFKARYRFFLENSQQYIYISSYRVFSDAPLISESTPRLLDVSSDSQFLKTNDYALEKARQEDILRKSRLKNWTIVRPSITYSKQRFQFGVLEADTVVWRALHDKPVILPREMLSVCTTMTWAGDVAKMIGGLTLNKSALGDDFNVVTAEHHTWERVSQIYQQAIAMRPHLVSLDEYIHALGGGYIEYQVKYDRMYTRILDNSKVLTATGLRQADFMSLELGLTRELRRFVEDPVFTNFDEGRQERIDALTDSAYVKIRKKLRIGTRLRSMLSKMKHKLRIRTRLRNVKKQLAYQKDWRNYAKIDGALITLPGYYNYGNMVQRFALQKFLRKNGYKFVSYAKDLPLNKEDEHRLKYTYDFVNRTIWRKQFDERDRFKTYIVGSDQVWRKWGFDDIFDELGYFFLDFTKGQKTNRIAYAASIGQDSLKEADYTDEFIPFAGELARDFDHVSMRELSGVELVKKEWSVNATHVLDPTMLLEATDYNELIDNAPYELKKPGELFTYCILTNDEKRKMIASISREVGIKEFGIYLEENDALRPVEEWLRNIRDAKLMVTDSFHGMVFCIIFNTPFVVLESGTGGAARITTLLGKLGLEDRFIVSGKVSTFKVADLTPIDWSVVNVKLGKLRAESAKWLLDAVRSR